MRFWRSWQWWAGLAAVAAFVGASILWFDRPVARWAAARPEAWQDLGKWLSELGQAHWVLLPGVVGAIWCRWWRPDRERLARFQAYCWAVALPSLAELLLKGLCGRARPKLLFEKGIYGFFPGTGWHYRYAGFPSGHNVTVTAAMTALWVLHPPGRPLYLAGALAMMAARVLAKGHFPADVVAGSFIGLTLALLVLRWRAAAVPAASRPPPAAAEGGA
ncbi:MAG: phosphatase PAP2 family protein [Lentisphaeria bacterium]|jgi:undecaprenyl-diphosphatase